MRSIILAAGRGSRFRNFTKDLPKCMIEFNGKPLLKYQIETLKNLNITDINLICGYKSNKIFYKNLNKIKNPNFLCTNMVYTLFCAEKIMDGNDDLLITYGDIIYEKKIIEKLLTDNSPIVVTSHENWLEYWSIRMNNPLSDLETFKVDKDNNIIELGKTPKSYDEIEGQFLGIIKIRKDHVKIFKKAWEEIISKNLNYNWNFKNMYMTDFLQYLINDGNKITPSYISSGWLEFDTYNDLKIYQKLFNQNSLDKFFKI